MKINRLVVICFAVLSLLIVLLLTTVFTRGLKDISKSNEETFTSVSDNVESNSEASFAGLKNDMQQIGDRIGRITETSASSQLNNFGNEITNQIKGCMDVSFSTVRTVGQILLLLKRNAEKHPESSPRPQAEAILREIVDRNQTICAIWSGWEPNQFDGHDAEFVGKEHVDEGVPVNNKDYVSEGCFLPWFFQSDGKILQGCLDDWRVAESRYYMEAFETGEETVIEPYCEGDDIVVSFAIPLKSEGKTIGVTGIDVLMSDLMDIVKNYKPFGGFAMLITPSGLVAYHPNKDVLFKLVDDPEEPGKRIKELRNLGEMKEFQTTLEYVLEGKNETMYTSTTISGAESEEMLVVHVPVQFGNYPKRWTVAVAAPLKKIMNSRNEAQNEIAAMLHRMTETNEKQTQTIHAAKTLFLSNADRNHRSLWLRSLQVGTGVFIFSLIAGYIFSRSVKRSIFARDHWYRQILDALNDPVAVVNMQRQTTFLNAAALKLIDRPLRDCVKRSDEEIWKDVIGFKFPKCGLRLLVSTGEHDSWTIFNGSNWDLYATYITNQHGTKDGMVEIFRNVDDRKTVMVLGNEMDGIVDKTLKSSEAITGATDSLAQGVKNQASRLQEVSEGIEQMSEQSDDNAKRAGEADHLTVNAKEAAHLGQQRMQEMIQSMNRIHENAQNTQKVIKTIDDIAFQTNLLALNAAVEAARAGTHGKGFAVVAEEVRNLAARSAKAAQETENLIVQSNAQIANGMKVVNQTGTALNSIAEHVAQVTTLVGEIATASKEQAGGTRRIRETLRQVDQISAQNLDLTDETYRSSDGVKQTLEDLRAIAKRLRR